MLARMAADFEVSPGREWRPLIDTTNQPTVSQRRPVSFVSWQLRENYYTEGELIWLDADTKIRELTDGQKSLDDSAKRFSASITAASSPIRTPLTISSKRSTALPPTIGEPSFGNESTNCIPRSRKTASREEATSSSTRIRSAWVAKAERGAGDFSTSIGFSVVVSRGEREQRRVGPAGSVANVWEQSGIQGRRDARDADCLGERKGVQPQVLRDAILQAEHEAADAVPVGSGEDYKMISLPYFGGLRMPSLERTRGNAGPARRHSRAQQESSARDVVPAFRQGHIPRASLWEMQP